MIHTTWVGGNDFEGRQLERAYEFLSMWNYLCILFPKHHLSDSYHLGWWKLFWWSSTWKGLWYSQTPTITNHPAGEWKSPQKWRLPSPHLEALGILQSKPGHGQVSAPKKQKTWTKWRLVQGESQLRPGYREDVLISSLSWRIRVRSWILQFQRHYWKWYFADIGGY